MQLPLFSFKLVYQIGLVIMEIKAKQMTLQG